MLLHCHENIPPYFTNVEFEICYNSRKRAEIYIRHDLISWLHKNALVILQALFYILVPNNTITALYDQSSMQIFLWSDC